MKMYPARLAMICIALSLPVAGYADNFDYNHTTAIAPDFFTADQSAAGIIGRDALSDDGGTVGEVADVIFDESGTVRGYIVDVGGFLGLDSRSLYIPKALAEVRIDGIVVQLVIDMPVGELKDDAKLD
ncbi:MAG: PRC-barrel domain-containing protein [Rhodobacteraceae bacterium]|nr:PRC-barrel domain-containing protein [Paracoccaceae bacterium]